MKAYEMIIEFKQQMDLIGLEFQMSELNFDFGNTQLNTMFLAFVLDNSYMLSSGELRYNHPPTDVAIDWLGSKFAFEIFGLENL